VNNDDQEANADDQQTQQDTMFEQDQVQDVNTEEQQEEMNDTTSQQEPVFTNSEVQKSSELLNNLKHRLDDIQKDFMNKMTTVVNNFIERLNQNFDERVTKYNSLMSEVEDAFQKNNTTAAQIQKTQLLTNSLASSVTSLVSSE
jgi:polyhydroxyalkanoate synthesis regulator phasin